MNKLGMSAIISHPGAGSIEGQIRLFADTGFDSFFLSCGVTDDFDSIPRWALLAREAGILFEAVHAPSDGADAMWCEGDAVLPHIAQLLRLIRLCAGGGVEKLVLHPAGRGDVPVSALGLERYADLERAASAAGVRICYENSISIPHLLAVVQQAGPDHGFCLDIGHHQCYTPDAPLLQRLGRRMLYTHLHDNQGAAAPGISGPDLHLLPFDGVQDCPALAAALRSAGYTGTLDLELACAHREDYRAMPYPDFVRLAHRRAQRLQALVQGGEEPPR